MWWGGRRESDAVGAAIFDLDRGEEEREVAVAVADLAVDWPRRLDLVPWERGRGAVQSGGRGRIDGGGGERRTAGFLPEVARTGRRRLRRQGRSATLGFARERGGHEGWGSRERGVCCRGLDG